MKIKKTVGQPGQYGKDYVIHTACGNTFLAERIEGSSNYTQFELGIDRSTLSEIKAVIERCEEFNFEEEPEPEEQRTVFELGPRAESLLALLFSGQQVDTDQVRQCLDNAGYIDPETREIDLDCARRDVAKWAKPKPETVEGESVC